MSNMLRTMRRNGNAEHGLVWNRGDSTDKTGCRRKRKAHRTGSLLDRLRGHGVAKTESGKVFVVNADKPQATLLDRVRAFFGVKSARGV